MSCASEFGSFQALLAGVKVKTLSASAQSPTLLTRASQSGSAAAPRERRACHRGALAAAPDQRTAAGRRAASRLAAASAAEGTQAQGAAGADSDPPDKGRCESFCETGTRTATPADGWPAWRMLGIMMRARPAREPRTAVGA